MSKQSKFDGFKTKATMKKHRIDPLELATVNEILTDLGIDPKEWDVLIVGDGSGTDWKNSCGWAAVLIDHWGNYRVPIYGGSNTGTNQLAELMPYVLAMAWYAAGPGEARIKARTPHLQVDDKLQWGGPDVYTTNTVNVHIVTDSQNLANQGNGINARNACRELWTGLDAYKARGYNLTWHWVGRMRLKLNQLVDMVASINRTTIADLKCPDGNGMLLADYLGNAIYESNPDDNPFKQIEIGKKGE